MIVPEADRASIATAVAARGFDLEELREDTRATSCHVTIVVDGDDGAPLDLLASLARELDPLAEQWGGPARTVTLEVSSRGADAPLTEPRHWRRNRGRSVDVHYTAGATGPQRARIGDLDAEAGTVRLVHRKGATVRAESVALDTVDRAVVRVEFAPAPAAELELLSEPAGSAGDGDTTEGN